MTTKEIALDLVELCREGKNEVAIEKYYSPNIVSIEADGPQRETVGLEGIAGKNAWFFNSYEIHGAVTSGPYVHDYMFIVHFNYDVTEKATGKRFPMIEAAHYTVEDGKIVRELFFY